MRSKHIGGDSPLPVIIQIVLGSLLLIACSLLQILIISGIIFELRARAIRAASAAGRRSFLIVVTIFFVLLAAHTVHVYVWAFAVWLMGALPALQDALYFSLVTYTTVGYGDLTLEKDFRVFGAMASVNGILAFGLSTAILVGVFSKMIGEDRS